jgi:hypothetical protein
MNPVLLINRNTILVKGPIMLCVEEKPIGRGEILPQGLLLWALMLLRARQWLALDSYRLLL